MVAETEATAKGGAWWPLGRIAYAWTLMRRWPVLPGLVLFSLIMVAILAPVIAKESPRKGSPLYRHIPPAWTAEGTSQHLLGTDQAGRDVFSRMVFGARVSLVVAAVSLASGFVIGSSLGIITGYIGGWWDEVIMRLVDIWQSTPFLMVALVLVIVVGQSMYTLFGLLGMLAWVQFVRVVRGQTMQLKQMDYVSLARVAGSGPVRIMSRHLAPGILNSAVVIATLNVGVLILAEASLSFLGAGIPPPTPSWGMMVGEGRGYIQEAWWTTVFPGAAIFLTVMSLNFMGDWLRDKLDPRLRQLV